MESLVGRKIKNDLMNSYGVTIVPAQTTLNREHIEFLKNHRIDPLSILFATENDNDKVNDSCRLAVRQTVDASRELFESIRFSRKIPIMEIRKEIVQTVQEISGSTDIFDLFESVKATDEYTYQHNIGVGILSTLIGRWLNLPEQELSMLSLAATLHDVGKVKIQPELLNKPGKLTNEEFALVKRHTLDGYELLKDTAGINHRIALVALQHHERNDGKGYPFGLKQEKTDFFSQIVAVADIFHAMSSKRPYHDPTPFYEIVSQMRKGLFGELDPNIVSVFLENIIKRTIGKEVVLTDGRVGQVVYLNPLDIETPLVKINDVFVDLSKQPHIHIDKILI